MKNINIRIKNKIMRKVYAIWAFKKLTSPFAVEVFSLFGLVAWLEHNVSIRQILKNFLPALKSVASVYHFLVIAFLGTELTTKIIFMGIAILSLFLLKDFVRLFRKKEVFQLVS